MKRFKSFINEIPLPIRLFLGKALLFFIAWKLVYGLFLYDSKYLDQALTRHVGEASVALINSLGSMEGFSTKRGLEENIYEAGVFETEVSQIWHHDKVVLYIANVCNGLELMILYIGFIVCMPSKFWRKLKYIVIGILLIDAINVLRCVGLIYLMEYYKIYFQFAHHYLFNALVYSATLLMWMVFSRKIHLKK